MLETSVLSGLKTHLMDPELVKEFAAEYHREVNRLIAVRDGDHARWTDELVRVYPRTDPVIRRISVKEENMKGGAYGARLPGLLTAPASKSRYP